MKSQFYLLFALFMAISSVSYSQTKALDKQTKKELKSYMKNPKEFRYMIKDYNTKISAYDSIITDLREDLYKADYLRVLYYDSIQALLHQLKISEKEANAKKNYFRTEGVDYRIQIGAYRIMDLTTEINHNSPIGYEKKDGVIQYFIGSYTDPDEAFEFTKVLRKFKITDAFITKYLDGIREEYHFKPGSKSTASN